MNSFPRFKSSLSLKDDISFLTKILVCDFQNFSLKSQATKVLKEKFCREVFFVSSFRIGLDIVLKTLNLKKQSFIAVSPINIPDVVNAILINDQKPFFYDLDLNDHIIHEDELQKLKENNVNVLIITYLSGLKPKEEKLQRIHKFCKENNIILVEDITQGYGIEFGGFNFGSLGRFSIGSTSTTKFLCSTYGGIILCDESDKEVVNSLVQNLLINSPSRLIYFYKHFYFLLINLVTSGFLFKCLMFPLLKRSKNSKNQKPKLQHLFDKIDVFNDEFLAQPRKKFPKSFYFNLNNWAFSFMMKSLKNMNAVIDGRRIMAQKLISEIREDLLSDVPLSLKDFNSSYYHFPFRYQGKSQIELREILLRVNIDSVGYGLNYCPEEIIFKEYKRNLPNAKKIKFETIFLPISEKYNADDVTRIIKGINEAFK